jgi:integrase
MAGSMRQRGRDSWQLRVYVGVDPHTHRSRYITRTVHGSRRAARAALAELEIEAGYAGMHAGNVANLLERWVATASAGWSPSTLRETRSLIRHHLLPHLGHLPVAKLTTEDIDDFYAHLLRAGGRDGGRLAPGTVRRIHVVLHRALVQALLWGWVFVNPAATASPPRLEPAEMHPPSTEEVAVLLSTVAHDLEFATYLRLAALTGARRSQLLALRWADVDFDHGALSFTRALVEGPDGPVLRPIKNRRTYRVALDDDTLQALRELKSRSLAKAETADASLSGKSFLFSPDCDGSRPWNPNTVTKRFIRVLRRAGLPHSRLHDLRHFMATTMLAEGVSVVTVSARLGHARASTTLNVYAHVVAGADKEAAQLLGDLFPVDKRCRD